MALPLTPAEAMQTIGDASEQINKRPLAILSLILCLLLAGSLYINWLFYFRVEAIQEERLKTEKEYHQKSVDNLKEQLKIADDARKADIAIREKELKEQKMKKK